MSRAQGRFSIPCPTPKVHPFSTFHVPLIPLHKSLYLLSACPFFLLHRLELDTHTQCQIPSKQSPKKKETNQTCLPAYSIIKLPTIPLPCRNSPRLCLSIYLYIYPPHPSPFLESLDTHHPQQINNNLPIHYYPRIIHLMLLLPSR